MFLISYVTTICLVSALFACLITSVYFLTAKNKKHFLKIGFISWFDCFYLTLFFIIVFKISQPLSKISFDLSQVQLIPFKTLLPYLQEGNVVQILGNIFICSPLPAILFLNFPKLALKRKIRLSLFITALIEPLQFIFNYLTNTSSHVIDVDDLILNLIGAILGIFLLLPFQKNTHKKL
jgi:glycopeptide antibiotics resistance protein